MREAFQSPGQLWFGECACMHGGMGARAPPACMRARTFCMRTLFSRIMRCRPSPALNMYFPPLSSTSIRDGLLWSTSVPRTLVMKGEEGMWWACMGCMEVHRSLSAHGSHLQRAHVVLHASCCCCMGLLGPRGRLGASSLVSLAHAPWRRSLQRRRDRCRAGKGPKADARSQASADQLVAAMRAQQAECGLWAQVVRGAARGFCSGVC